MDIVGWRPCRVLPFDGRTSGETAGPKAARCTYGVGARTANDVLQRGCRGRIPYLAPAFSGGRPEQITFGATEEEGIAVSPDDHCLVTSAGIRQSTVWLHDARGDRQISGEGFATIPGLGFGTGVHSVFSPDGKTLFYMVRKQGTRAFKSGELWMADLTSGRSWAALPGISMSEFDIAPDGSVLSSRLSMRRDTPVYG